MSIDQLKKRAKNLQRLYPEFSEKHANVPPKLTDFQELIARVYGYPSFHAAATRISTQNETANRNKPATAVNSDAVASRLVVASDARTFQEYRQDGSLKAPRTYNCVFFQPKHLVVHAAVTSSLDELLDDLDTFQRLGANDPPPSHSLAMIDLCNELVQKEPGFIDGYAHWANALFYLGKIQEVIDLNRPIYDTLTGMLPSKFTGRIPYSIDRNRPFHRLAYTLVLAYWKLNTVAGDRSAAAIAKQMVKWWPNDNLDFAGLTSKPPEES